MTRFILKVVIVGNSAGIIIPKDILKEMKLFPGARVEIDLIQKVK